ncbi:hypothetical protein LB505_004813 [Fusarium chuoi]|nr:hypothetical protein LB505_004813 [Fusarium chuoi]
MSVAAMVSPSTPSSLDPRRDRPTSIESNGLGPNPGPTMGDTLAPGRVSTAVLTKTLAICAWEALLTHLTITQLLRYRIPSITSGTLIIYQSIASPTDTNPVRIETLRARRSKPHRPLLVLPLDTSRALQNPPKVKHGRFPKRRFSESVAPPRTPTRGAVASPSLSRVANSRRSLAYLLVR